MLQRLALCRTFLHDPDLLLLDEPFDGLDVEGADLLHAELAERIGVTALVATHEPEALASRATARLAIA
jgi:ABC-type multidrug transport system ATPase subunit